MNSSSSQANPVNLVAPASRQRDRVEDVSQIQTSLGSKLLGIFVTPGLVFEEVAASPAKLANWIVPTALVALFSLVTLHASTNLDAIGAATAQLVDAGKMSQSQAGLLSGQWKRVSRAAILIAPFAGTIWSAFVLWFMGKVFLKSRFALHKALEVSALSGTILILGAVITWLLVAATGDASARPALSLVCLKLPQDSLLRTTGGLLDGIHLWTTGVLAVGLSKLAHVTFKESAFWVFGYWLITKGALLLLA
jgi:hypothetical protein